MNRLGSIDEVTVGAVLWAYARGYWRQVRVMGKRRRTVTVAYYVQATRSASPSIRYQDLPAHRLRTDRPNGSYGVVDVTPPAAPAVAAAS